MAFAERRYVLDTNLFIQGLRDDQANVDLQRFHTLFSPFEFLSVVVAQELRAGARTSADRKALEKHLIAPFVRRGRLLVPSARAWEQSGDILSELVRKDGLVLPGISKAFGNDILLALSCRESGMVLVTENTRDFDRIARFAAFQYVRPWPAPIS